MRLAWIIGIGCPLAVALCAQPAWSWSPAGYDTELQQQVRSKLAQMGYTLSNRDVQITDRTYGPGGGSARWKVTVRGRTLTGGGSVGNRLIRHGMHRQEMQRSDPGMITVDPIGLGWPGADAFHADAADMKLLRDVQPLAEHFFRAHAHTGLKQMGIALAATQLNVMAIHRLLFRSYSFSFRNKTGSEIVTGRADVRLSRDQRSQRVRLSLTNLHIEREPSWRHPMVRLAFLVRRFFAR